MTVCLLPQNKSYAELINKHETLLPPTKKYFCSNFLKATRSTYHGICGICLSEYTDNDHSPYQITVPSCKHVFGKACIYRLLSESNKCPYCRSIWYKAMDISMGPENYSEDDKDLLSSDLAQQLRSDVSSVRYFMFREEVYKDQAPPTTLSWIEHHHSILMKIESLIVYDEGFIDRDGYFRELFQEREQVQHIIRRAQSPLIDSRTEFNSEAVLFDPFNFESWDDGRNITNAIFSAVLSPKAQRLCELLDSEIQAGKTREEAVESTILRWLEFSIHSTDSVEFLRLFLLVVWVLSPYLLAH